MGDILQAKFRQCSSKQLDPLAVFRPPKASKQQQLLLRLVVWCKQALELVHNLQEFQGSH